MTVTNEVNPSCILSRCKTATKLKAGEIREKLPEGWVVLDFNVDGGVEESKREENLSVFKKFQFGYKKKDSFAKAKQFVDLIAEYAEKKGHHPDIKFGWGYAEVFLSTHAVKGVSEIDIEMAERIQTMFEEFKET